MRVPLAQACTRSVQYSFDQSQTPTADPHGWRAASRARAAERGSGERRRSHAASARARVGVPTLAAGLLLRHHEDAYQCVRTCPGARGWGESWVAGAEPSSCTEMALHVVVVCSTYQPRPAAGDSWAASIMVAEELPHLIQPVAEAWTADRSLVSKRTRQRVCHEWFKVAMVPAQYLHSSGEHTAHSCTWVMSGAHEGCSQGKSVGDRELGSKHSTAATLERVEGEAAVLPQDLEDTVHARQLLALCRRVGRRMSRQGPGRSPSI